MKRGICACCIGLGLLLPPPVMADETLSPREQIAKGNELYAAGDYAAALKAYQAAAEGAGTEVWPELLHDQAAAYFKLGDLAEAREHWVRALASEDVAFEARTRYNLGNCDYAEALKALEAQDMAAAQDALDRATAQYIDAVRLDPTLPDVRANLELAYQLKQRLEQASEQQPESQPSTQPSEQQQQQQDQNQGQNQDQDQDQQQQEQPPPTSQPTSQPQQPDEQDREESSPESQPQSEQQPQPESQPSSQPQAGDENQPQPEQQPEEGEGEEQTGEQPSQVIHLTPEQAERLLQQIRDAEKARREMLRRRQAARHKPVERDW
ncbi:MAG: tetratricopeptide repeat protein [Phycisphaerae bacterium]|jgi:Ca-activated chloride channel family protein